MCKIKFMGYKIEECLHIARFTGLVARKILDSIFRHKRRKELTKAVNYCTVSRSK